MSFTLSSTNKRGGGGGGGGLGEEGEGAGLSLKYACGPTGFEQTNKEDCR